ncbi:carbamate kinase [Limnochorda pilosa]|uniref:Carbamate kinase n=1 Tax=Limnochorda pilosa TaxID=1555112 RepID=A0A0K2SJU1_LIMPI|nr:carbamate kinase [Limnochorda pilosa]BAS27381.1 carbamate kinase [Limnochorda pilosa]
MGQRILVALGGNAILHPGQRGWAHEQMENLKETARALAVVAQEGHDLVLTHGNGPQVGSLLIQQAMASAVVPPWPLDFCDAASQGLIGYMIQQTLGAELEARGVERQVVSVVTRVRVDPDDPAFTHPTKPVGPFYDAEEAARGQARGEAWVHEAGRGWRRVVPSPEPVEILELDAVRRLLDGGAIPVAVGGGGVPVVRTAEGRLDGVEAVIDKDLASSLLARALGMDRFLILTDVDQVYRDYATPHRRPLPRLTPGEADVLLSEGQLAAGSMGPKVRAAAAFARSGGVAHIGALAQVEAILAGRAGTWIAAS